MMICRAQCLFLFLTPMFDKSGCYWADIIPSLDHSSRWMMEVANLKCIGGNALVYTLLRPRTTDHSALAVVDIFSMAQS